LGIYLGGTVGATNFNDTVSINNTSGTPPMLGQLGFMGGGVVGYEKPITNHFHLGVEFFGNGTTSKPSLTDAATGLKFTSRYQANYGVRALSGYQLTPSTLAHLIVGYTRGAIRFTDTGAATSAGAAESFSSNGYEIGLGGVTELMSNVFIRKDVIFSGYTSHTVYANIGPITYNNHNINTADALLILLYRF